MKYVKLFCSCCGNSLFMGIQHPEHDKGYGTCKRCKDWIISKGDKPNDQQYKTNSPNPMC